MVRVIAYVSVDEGMALCRGCISSAHDGGDRYLVGKPVVAFFQVDVAIVGIMEMGDDDVVVLLRLGPYDMS